LDDGKKGKKYIVILIDGAADYRLGKLGARTPLQVAKKPAIDYLAKNGIVGMVNTIPYGMPPGSDTGNLSVLGYDPARYLTGRSSLEAVSIGIELGDDDITFRTNLVTLSGEDEYEEKKMIDYSAGEITTGQARSLITALAKKLERKAIKFYTGVSYRHVMVWKNGPQNIELTPPHDITSKKIKDYLPKGDGSEAILGMMKESSRILENHDVNIKRACEGKRAANSIWLWGMGKKPSLDSFKDKYGIDGSVISAVDLVKGIGICAGLRSIDVKGATGNIDTNFSGKADAAIKEIEDGQDFVYIHIEAPDECGHKGSIGQKIRAIELIDEKVVKKIKQYFDMLRIDYRLMVLPDHPTPIEKKTHTTDPVPFLIFDNRKIKENKNQVFDEFYPQRSGIFFEHGYRLMDFFLEKTQKTKTQ